MPIKVIIKWHMVTDSSKNFEYSEISDVCLNDFVLDRSVTFKQMFPSRPTVFSAINNHSSHLYISFTHYIYTYPAHTAFIHILHTLHFICQFENNMVNKG